jgi:hypothetical protein
VLGTSVAYQNIWVQTGARLRPIDGDRGASTAALRKFQAEPFTRVRNLSCGAHA